ncbi:hypothetical protein DCAR_0522406 [Daucus carota subsp. sativus]|uniref:Uncharacterized protein n=1 Tax=Daucus carota subsp. sativus TaxID=79200 RepID=A0A164ZSN1_DAUCS|nr:PREDICTED: transcription factor TCP4 [Daucus carota subsp. sativus]WOH03015.1 hypothetical protein DCAR_0522406 [Daucus carota subsp. sativus]
MGDSSAQNQQITASRLGGLRKTSSSIGGEIVEVQGGHIVRSTGRKDRHSKVCTAKGPRDRRVRLSAHTAIQFYDVQDRLGYDRPSKAVDWLIKKAKAAIDELEELPAWTPTTGSIPIINPPNQDQSMHHQLQQQQQQQQLHLQQHPPNDNSSSFLPASMDSDSIADTIKSFFPMSASADTNTSNAANVQFHQHNFQQHPRSTSQNQDLRLSLQSLQDPMLLHHQNQHEQTTGLFSGTHQMSNFDGSGWSEPPSHDISRFSRMVSWNAGGDTGGSGVEGGAFVFNSPSSSMQMQQQQQALYGQTQLLFSQRRPLQSSNTPSICAWIDPSTYDHQAASSFPYQPSSMSGIGFASAGEFSGFRVPARIQGEEEEHDRVSDKPSSASSDSPQ